jgi:hypothetical protein
VSDDTIYLQKAEDQAYDRGLPTYERRRPDDRDGLEDRWKPSIQYDQEQAIPIREWDATAHPPPQHNQLMSECRVLCLKSALRSGSRPAPATSDRFSQLAGREGVMGNRKYHSDNLIPMFRKAATLRNEMIAAGFTDNGGAIHSAERVLNLLAQRIKYPGLGHINDFRKFEGAEFSVEALTAYKKGGQVLIEHVSPIRAFTRRAIELVGRHATDDELIAFIKSHYQLVLLTPEETRRLNKQNRSKMAVDRLKDAGIQLADASASLRLTAPHAASVT